MTSSRVELIEKLRAVNLSFVKLYPRQTIALLRETADALAVLVSSPQEELPPGLEAEVALFRENPEAWHAEWRRQHEFKVNLLRENEELKARLGRGASSPSAGDLLCEAVDAWVRHQPWACEVDPCSTCDVTFNRVRLAWKVWSASSYKATTPTPQQKAAVDELTSEAQELGIYEAHAAPAEAPQYPLGCDRCDTKVARKCFHEGCMRYDRHDDRRKPPTTSGAEAPPEEKEHDLRSTAVRDLPPAHRADGPDGADTEGTDSRRLRGQAGAPEAANDGRASSRRELAERDRLQPIAAPHPDRSESISAQAEERWSAEKSCCTVCDRRKECHICGTQTLYACSDCRIDFGVSIYVCTSSACRTAHESKHRSDAGLRALVEKWRRESRLLSIRARSNTLRECADELDAALAASGSARQRAEQDGNAV